MKVLLSEITRSAMALPQGQRMILVRTILAATENASDPLPEVEQAWEDEIAARIAAIQSGNSRSRSWESVLRDIDAELAS